MSEDQRRRLGPFVFDWTITLTDLSALIAAVITALYAFVYLDRKVEEHDKRIARVETRQDGFEVRIADKLERINEKLDQLIGRVNNGGR